MLQNIFLTVISLFVAVIVFAALEKMYSRLFSQTTALRRKNKIVGLISILVFVALLFLVWWPEGKIVGGINETFQKYDVYFNLFWSVLLAVIAYISARVMVRVAVAKDIDLQARYKLRKLVVRSTSFIYVALLILIWSNRIENVAVFLGIVGAGIAVAFQEPLLCTVGWTFILVKKPFDVGDRIELAGSTGDVIDIGLFQISMLEVGNWVHADQSTGRILNVPNSAVFRDKCFNYTTGFPFIWNEITTVLTFESDWRRAKEIVLGLAQGESDAISSEVQRRISEMQGRYAIQFKQFTPIVYTHIAPEGVALTLRYLTPVRNRRGTHHKINEGILDAFLADTTIDFAYPTTRFYNNTNEGNSPFSHDSQHQNPPTTDESKTT